MSTEHFRYGFWGVCNSDSLPESMYRAFFDVASAERKERAVKYLKREAACRTLVADLLFRYAVRHTTGLDIRRLNILKNEYGKPMFENLDLHFNISHSGEWVVCAIDKYEIGIDIEEYRPIDIRIAERFFSRKEILFINGFKTEEERYCSFFKIWTLKESYIKSIGKGLYCPLNHFSCILSEAGAPLEFEPLSRSLPVKKFRLLDIDPCYSCAICGSETIFKMTPIVLTPEKLLELNKQ